ncbi:hypothetical protein B5P45_02120 [Phyllobacterium zundukense]|uniref:HD-CE domain-containing protein n=1 Tax=Phyllobacterium zundukense TaxID=1867719 RepID=A0A2N9W4F1_9HYPH|nr:hypothetical protein BLM14_09960 [Phyllobacterium zundukense]PIO46619.1 hypothetical protein B5P45_02120 [Phyllobacterium zundukense]
MLWKKLFENNDDIQHSEQVERLVSTYKNMRSQVAYLVGEISVDLPQYTVHDITHLDALWDIADQITGENYSINPLEGFVLGGALLFHDAGMTMASYPGD